MNVPITVKTLSIKTIVPANNKSCASKAFNNIGPVVGRLNTIDTIA